MRRYKNIDVVYEDGEKIEILDENLIDSENK